MAAFGRGRRQPESQERILDVTASMEGSLIFQDPVVLRISGRFEGNLQTRGELTIGPQAQVNADLTGDTIVIAGRVTGKVVARNSLKIIPPGVVRGEIWTPVLEVQTGAQLHGNVRMGGQESWMSLQEVAEYLEVEPRVVEQWVREGKLSGTQEGGQWKFEKAKIDEWVSTQKSS